MTMTTDHTGRTARYLDDLARLLDPLDPIERAEVLDTVREHLDSMIAELDQEPTDADIDRILTSLGAPGQVAEAALADWTNRTASSTTPAPQQRPALSRVWVPPVALAAIVLGSLSAPFLVPILVLVAGVVLLCVSPLWSPWQKVLGAVGIPLGLVPVLLATLVVMRTTSAGEQESLNAWAVIVPASAILSLAITAYVLVVGIRRASRWE
ncbi:HAAS signaling domain-containing protein [Ruania rhizosphaerae]|uniref:HAAS signaling domain-containing protein n=1 Tax=Ruania rhizosphaerae TaxID=1840413 RepID=UPI00135AE47B|nr:hypothetical protein [Ruania rhizosphaerae]